MRFFVNNPFVYVCLSFVAGIFSVRFLPFPPLFFAIGGLLCWVWAVVSYRRMYAFSVALSVAVFFLGAFLCRRAVDGAAGTFTGKSALFQVRLLSHPVEKPKTYACTVAVQYAFPSDTLSIPEQGNAIVYLPNDSLSARLSAGDILLVDAFFPSYVPETNPCRFDYPAYLLRRGIASTAYVPAGRWDRVGHAPVLPLYRWADASRDSLLAVYRKYGISGRAYAVLSSLTLGCKEDLDADTRRMYSASGAMHILAVSGLHVGIVYMLVSCLLFFLGNSDKARLLRSLCVILALWIYAFITGLSPSVLRACLMFSVGRLALCFDRRGNAVNTIAFSAFLMLLVNPLLVYDVSFRLSYSAVLSIILVQPRLASIVGIGSSPFLRWGFDLLSVSLAAQLGTFVWSLLYFNQFSTYFLLSNIVVVPAASVIIPLAVLLFVLSPFPLLAGVVARVLSALLSFVNEALAHVESLPFSTFSVYITPFQAFLLFACVAAAVVILLGARKYLFPAAFSAMLCCIVFFGIRFYRLYDTSRTGRLVVYAAGRQTVVHSSNRCCNLVFTSDTLHSPRYTSVYSLRQRLSPPRICPLPDDAFVPFMLARQRCLFLSGNVAHYGPVPSPLSVDNLILGRMERFSPDKLFSAFAPARVVITQALGGWQRGQVVRYCSAHGIPFFDIRTQGAFILSLPAVE